jgi:hypothetical protein
LRPRSHGTKQAQSAGCRGWGGPVGRAGSRLWLQDFRGSLGFGLRASGLQTLPKNPHPCTRGPISAQSVKISKIKGLWSLLFIIYERNGPCTATDWSFLCLLFDDAYLPKATPRNGFEWVMALHMSDQTPEAAQFQLAENFLRKSRSTLWIATSLASQRRAALAAISANTRRRSAGELEITRNISAVAAC